MLKRMQKLRKIHEPICDLIEMWYDWMRNHKIVNDESVSFSIRRECGMECERLQDKRQRLICEIDRIVGEKWKS